MLGKEDACSGDGSDGGGSKGSCQISSARKTFWRSASWSSSRLPPLNPDSEKDNLDSSGSNGGRGRRYLAPLTPRSQQNCKARSCLPPLQPLAIARRSLDEWPRAGSDDIGEWPLPCTPGGRDLNNNGERLKLDLSTIQGNTDNSCRLLKRERIAFFDKKCSKVAMHIYLGGDAVARERDILKQHAITHILNCVGFVCTEYFKSDFVYQTLWLQDSPSEDITSILYDVFDYFEDVREQGGRVFVHCCQGVSRSTSLVIAYLMWREGQSFDDAFQYVKAARGIADPNMGFACQLLQCQKRVHAFPLSPSSLLRMYRIAPHSPYDPLHLVPKMLNDPSVGALDSRGAFIIHTPSTIYIWVGKKCENLMERDGRGAVCQIVRYEKVHGPIEMIREGEEPLYFWDAFSSFLPMMDKPRNGVDLTEIKPGERKVDSYDVDYEIFQKAIVGGFVPPFASSETEHETHLPARESTWSALRRKFSSGNMKEFVFASKPGLSRVYPDIMFTINVDNPMVKPALQSVSSLSSSSPSTMSLFSSPSSSSPPFLSPDSISSDSCTSLKCSSDSPAASPSTTSSSEPLSSTLSSFSSMSLVSSKNFPHSISKSSKFIDVNFTSRPCSELASSPSKRLPLSIAERRGSLSKCLKLPTLTDYCLEKDVSSSFLTSEQDEVSISNSTCLSNEQYNMKQTLGSLREEYVEQENEFLGSVDRVGSIDFCYEKATAIEISEALQKNDPSKKKETIFLNGMLDDGPFYDKSMQSVVYRWPTLEKVVAFDSSGLDSTSVFIFISSSSVVDKIGDSILYLWVGRSFNCDKSVIQLMHQKDLGVEEIDWNQVGFHVRVQIGLPESTNVKIIKENNEPAEFLALLHSLQC